jgi:hypothetical protein
MSRESHGESQRARVVYLNEGGQMVAVAVNTESAFSISKETPLFSTSGYLRPTGSSVGTFNHPVYAVAPDDQRFLMIKMPPNTEGELIVVENFFEELKAKVGN